MGSVVAFGIAQTGLETISPSNKDDEIQDASKNQGCKAWMRL